ncbi:MAG TPA: hypothetical protein PKM48_00040 [Parvularculaceae bacterium]|nr:hypothetical protein [Parvularculaceae bacterium]HNS85972.1 hypothetical protein [Parvularculaceae bacterium]
MAALPLPNMLPLKAKEFATTEATSGLGSAQTMRSGLTRPGLEEGCVRVLMMARCVASVETEYPLSRSNCRKTLGGADAQPARQKAALIESNGKCPILSPRQLNRFRL